MQALGFRFFHHAVSAALLSAPSSSILASPPHGGSVCRRFDTAEGAIAVQSLRAAAAQFDDGFERGSHANWSVTVPVSPARRHPRIDCSTEAMAIGQA